MGKAKAGPVVSDNGNFIIDAPFSTEDLKDPLRVSLLPLAPHPDRGFRQGYGSLQILKLIKMLTGVVEVGLFCRMARAAYFGNTVGFPYSAPGSGHSS
jgi:ribose 5-phosphate isomerase A